MKIAIGSDHGGYALKEKIKTYLDSKNIPYEDFGTHSTDSCDYPDFAHPLANAVAAGEVDGGIAICGTGNGMAITLNHHKGIRAGLAWNTAVAALVKEHNNANVLVLPARFVSYAMANACVRTWLATPFAGGRHQRRIDKIEA